ncbi:MAG TPA: prepilin peptidase [Bryobacteraceae bacterium]|nr:prepilin peptidase [Bryobacteraceae bacterium]
MLEAAFAGLFGLLIGSFLNVCIYRLPRDLSVVRPRSFCPNCERQIGWFDNIPVLTWILLRGRCRHCKARISVRYPLVEALTGGLFFAAFALHGPGLPAVKLALFSALQVGLVFTDLEERILPDEFTIGGTVAGLAFSPFVPVPFLFMPLFFPPEADTRWISLAESVFGAAVTSITLWSIGVLYRRVRGREGLGLGDVKMLAMIGAFLGVPGALLTVVVGSLAGSILGLAFIVATRRSARTYELPFGTFLGAAAVAVAFWTASAAPPLM